MLSIQEFEKKMENMHLWPYNDVIKKRIKTLQKTETVLIKEVNFEDPVHLYSPNGWTYAHFFKIKLSYDALIVEYDENKEVRFALNKHIEAAIGAVSYLILWDILPTIEEINTNNL